MLYEFILFQLVELIIPIFNIEMIKSMMINYTLINILRTLVNILLIFVLLKYETLQIKYFK